MLVSRVTHGLLAFINFDRAEMTPMQQRQRAMAMFYGQRAAAT